MIYRATVSSYTNNNDPQNHFSIATNLQTSNNLWQAADIVKQIWISISRIYLQLISNCLIDLWSYSDS